MSANTRIAIGYSCLFVALVLGLIGINQLMHGAGWPRALSLPVSVALSLLGFMGLHRLVEWAYQVHKEERQ